MNNIDFDISHIRFQLLRNFHDLLENLLKVVPYRAVDKEVHRGIKTRARLLKLLRQRIQVGGRKLSPHLNKRNRGLNKVH